MKRLFLVDGSNHAFRVHFALPPMHDSSGFPTRALYGFTQLFGKLVRTYKPDYVAVAFDHGETFRHVMYPEYKGHRPDMPEDLRAQWPLLPTLVEAFGYRVVKSPGFEADDVLGALAKKYGSEDVEVILVTGDHDYYQLVDGHIRVLDDMKDEEIGPAEVLAKLGLGPDRVIDIKALAGDTSDNIPGVPGIGEKTAVKYLQKYGDVEAVLANWKDIGGKRGEALRDNAANARLSRELATIRLDTPLDVSLDELAPQPLHEDQLRELFDRWGFGMMARKLLPERKALVAERWRIADDLPALEAQLRALGEVAVDVEVVDEKIRGASFAWDGGDAVYVGIEGADTIARWLADEKIAKVMHDHTPLLRAGVVVRNVVSDTLLLDYVLSAHESDHSLEKLANRHLAHTLVPPGAGGLPFAPAVAEAAKGRNERAATIFAVDRSLRPRLDAGQKSLYETIELPLVAVLARMERAGIAVDLARLDGIKVDLDARLIDLEKACHDKAERVFNVNSRHDVSSLLFESGRYPSTASKKLKDGTFSTESGILEKLVSESGDDLPSAILAYRQLQKLKGTYVDKLPGFVRNGRIHTTLDQAVAATGRLSSRDPNLQNIPIRSFEGRRIRDCFVPSPGNLLFSADYSQIELRLLAHLTGEDSLIASFAAGEDIHRRTASECFNIPIEAVTQEQRNAAKAINFGLMYGMSSFRLASNLQISREEAQAYVDKYFARLPKVASWLENTRAEARKRGFVETIFGRKRVLPEIQSKNFNERMTGEREAINTPVQGAAADIIKIAMIHVDKMLREEGFKAKLILQVHDELLFDVPEDEVSRLWTRVIDLMKHAGKLRAPLEVNAATGTTWNEAHG